MLAWVGAGSAVAAVGAVRVRCSAGTPRAGGLELDITSGDVDPVGAADPPGQRAPVEQATTTPATDVSYTLPLTLSDGPKPHGTPVAAVGSTGWKILGAGHPHLGEADRGEGLLPGPRVDRRGGPDPREVQQDRAGQRARERDPACSSNGASMWTPPSRSTTKAGRSRGRHTVGEDDSHPRDPGPLGKDDLEPGSESPGAAVQVVRGSPSTAAPGRPEARRRAGTMPWPARSAPGEQLLQGAPDSGATVPVTSYSWPAAEDHVRAQRSSPRGPVARWASSAAARRGSGSPDRPRIPSPGRCVPVPAGQTPRRSVRHAAAERRSPATGRQDGEVLDRSRSGPRVGLDESDPHPAGQAGQGRAAGPTPAMTSAVIEPLLGLHGHDRRASGDR